MLMNGSWHIYRPGERWQQPRVNMRIVIETSEYHAIGFRVPVAQIHTARSLARELRIPGSASDLLSSDFDAEAALQRFIACGDEELGDVLLHQRVLAGVGNVYKSEVCFATRLNPFRKVATLSEEQVVEVIGTARKQLGTNVVEDSSNPLATFHVHGRRTTNEMDPEASLWAYGRAGEPCRRCGEPICSRLQGVDARITFWCARCQPMPDGGAPHG
jgi:endonuclease-8